MAAAQIEAEDSVAIVSKTRVRVLSVRSLIACPQFGSCYCFVSLKTFQKRGLEG